MTIVIIDYEVGNFRNVQRAFEAIKTAAIISRDLEVISGASGIVLPGVGAFSTAMDKIESFGLDKVLIDKATQGIPILGICLGMQLLADCGTEGGLRKGLGILPMKVEPLNAHDAGLRLPHVGWNNVTAVAGHRLFQRIDNPDPDFYFVHSYRVLPTDPDIIAATCSYGEEFVCAVERKNIFAVQFHPEKSQQYGRDVLRSFADYTRPSNSEHEL